MNPVLKEEKKINREVGNIISEDRLVNFSDAVFAFAATLLVLKIDLPQIVKEQLTTTQFLTAFQILWPQYLANIISFLIIGYYWLHHHAIFGLMRKFDAPVIWINLAFLILVSFLPFPVDLYGDFLMNPVVVVFYSASLALVGYMLAFIWWYASYHHRLISSDLSKKQINYYTARNLIAPVVFTLSIPLVYIDPLLAQFSWVFVIIGIFAINTIFQVKKLTAIEKMSI